MSDIKVDLHSTLARFFKILLDTQNCDQDLVPYLQYIYTESPGPLNVTCFKAILSTAMKIDGNKDRILQFVAQEPLELAHFHFFMNDIDLFHSMIMMVIKNETVFPRILMSKFWCGLELEGLIPRLPTRGSFEPAIGYFSLALKNGYEKVRFTFTDVPENIKNAEFLINFYRDVDKILEREGKCVRCYEITATRNDSLRVVIWNAKWHCRENIAPQNRNVNLPNFVRREPPQGRRRNGCFSFLFR